MFPIYYVKDCVGRDLIVFSENFHEKICAIENPSFSVLNGRIFFNITFIL